MSDVETHTGGSPNGGHSGHNPNHPHTVAITVDGHRKEILKGNYLVSDLKAKVGVPADYDLDLVLRGEFHQLADTAHIEIKGGEHFVSHVRRGGSS